MAEHGGENCIFWLHLSRRGGMKFYLDTSFTLHPVLSPNKNVFASFSPHYENIP
jgi:hypothetical protein